MDENEVPGLGAGGISGDIFSTPTTAAFDAIKLMFGNWVELVFTDGSNGSATILTELAGYMNYLAYVLITVIMTYVLLSSVVNTAADGKVLGKGGASVVWLPFRTFMACILIFPVSIGNAQSISFIQIAATWLGMVGSNAADRVAEYVVDNFQRTAFNLNTTVNGYTTVMRMTEMAYCTEGFNQEPLINNSEFTRPADMYGQVMAFPGNTFKNPDNWEIHGAYEVVDRVVSGPIGVGPTVRQPKHVPITPSLVGENHRSVDIGFRGECGNITVIPTKGETLLAKAIMTIALDTQQAVYTDVVGPIKDLGYNAATIDSKLGSPQNSEYEKIFNAVMTSSSNMLRLMDQYEQRVGDALSERMDEGNRYVDFVNEDGRIIASINKESYGDQGWIYLGSYYSIISGAIGKVQDLAGIGTDIATPTGVDGCRIASREEGAIKRTYNWLTGKDPSEACNYDRFNDNYKTVAEYANKMLKTSGNAENQLYSACTDMGNCSKSLFSKAFAVSLANTFVDSFQMSSTEQAQGFINMFGGSDVGGEEWGLNTDVGGIESGTGFSPGALFLSDPLSDYAVKAKNVANTAAGMRTAINLTKGVAEGSQRTGIPGLNFFTATVGATIVIFLDFLLVILSILQGVVVTGAFLLPLLPSLIWAMVVIGWLLLFAEAVFNAPLAVVLLATPEGSGILGSRMERKLALMAALILRPTFFIGGLFISMMIMSIGSVILNQMFWISSSSVFGSFDPLSVVAMIIIWFTVMGSFLIKCLQITPSFADTSLEWFTGGIAKQFGNNFDGEMSQKFEGMGAQTQNVGDLSGRGIGGLMSGAAKKKSIGVFGNGK